MLHRFFVSKNPEFEIKPSKSFSERGAGSRQTRAHRSRGDPERGGNLVVRQLRPGVEEEDLALFRHEFSKRGGNPRTDQRGAQALVTHGEVLAKLGVDGKPSVELELVLLRPPLASKQIYRYAEQPGSQASLSGVEVMAPSEGDGESLGGQIIGEGGTDPTSDESVDGWEVVFERLLEDPTISDRLRAGRDRFRSSSALHIYLLSPPAVAFPIGPGHSGITPGHFAIH